MSTENVPEVAIEAVEVATENPESEVVPFEPTSEEGTAPIVIEGAEVVPFEVTEVVKPAATVVIAGRVLPAGNGQYFEFRAEILEVRETIEQNQLALAEMLHKVQAESIFIAFGYESFGQWVEEEIQIGTKHASNLVQTWDYFGKLCVEAQTIIKKLGPTKAQHLVGHLTNENFGELEGWLRSNPTVKEIAAKFKPDSVLAKGTSTKNNDGTIRVSFNLLPEEKEVVTKGVQSEREGGAVSEGTALARIVTRDQINVGGKAPQVILKDALLLNTGITESALVELVYQTLGMRIMTLNEKGEISGGLQYLDEEGNPKSLVAETPEA